MTTYISGPMTGYPDWNFPAFNKAAERLRRQGCTVVNPAEGGADESLSWSDYLRADIALLTRCDAIYMLKGWRESRGARLEYHIAYQLGMLISHETTEKLI